MRGRATAYALAAAALLLALPGPARAGTVRAGAAAVDATWHVGASAGQYAEDPQGRPGLDLAFHSVLKPGSYGVQSRLSARALVIRGPDGSRVAIVKNDLYIPQDLLWRRTAQLLEEGDSGIGRENLTMAVSHDHSSPYYSSTSPGAWTFQDVFDIRFFDYMAKRQAEAVERAADELAPVRVGASATAMDEVARNALGPAVADDGTPAGFPESYVDPDLTVIRLDDISRPGRPRPLANLVNYSLHPEFLDGNNLISADFLGPLERMVDRETGALTIWTTGAVGTSEPERNTHHPIGRRLDFTHREYGQAEYGARLMADRIVDTWRAVARAKPDPAYRERFVPFDSAFPVAMEDRFFPGPLTHPYPTAQNCRTEPALHLDPRIGTLPDCVRGGEALGEVLGAVGLGLDAPELPRLPIDPGITAVDVKRLGIPIPDNLSLPSSVLLEEDVSVHLQAIRLGDILLTMCSCEQWADQSRNIRSRTNRRQGDIWLGYDWSKRCDRGGDGTWTCPNPRHDRLHPDVPRKLPPIDDEAFQRMRAQVRNDAAGWNEPSYIRYAESEPPDPEDIKGNFTHSELPRSRAYRMTVPVGQANDYNGYIATYREYQRGDHYRKALTGWGPHSSDYMATRLVQMGGQLRGGAAPPREPFEAKGELDQTFNDLRAQALGRLGKSALDAYDAILPDDGGDASAVSQPHDIRRFEAAFFTWNGGSNFTDDPVVVVERRTRRGWDRYADQSGEVPVTLRFPRSSESAAYLSGSHRWHWTAHFEAFTSEFDTGEVPRSTPPGRYRFVVRGKRREAGGTAPYRLESSPFRIRRWDGIEITSISTTGSGRVRFNVGPKRTVAVPRDGKEGRVRSEIGPIDYPDSYESPARFIDDERSLGRDVERPDDARLFEWFCFACSFRPWVDTAEVGCTRLAIVDAGGRVSRARARAGGGAWTTRARVPARGAALVQPGGVIDENGERNRAASKIVGWDRASKPARRKAARLARTSDPC